MERLTQATTTWFVHYPELIIVAVGDFPLDENSKYWEWTRSPSLTPAQNHGHMTNITNTRDMFEVITCGTFAPFCKFVFWLVFGKFHRITTLTARFVRTTNMNNFLELYEPLDIIGNGSFGIIRKVRRKSDGQVSPQVPF